MTQIAFGDESAESWEDGRRLTDLVACLRHSPQDILALGPIAVDVELQNFVC